MENLIVGFIVAGALVFILRSFIKTYKGEGDCGSSCGGCRESAGNGTCGQDRILPKN